MIIGTPHRRPIFWMAGLALLILSAQAAFAAGPTAQELIGTGVPIFSLATSQGTLANYDRDYYGKHHLVLTFFPAAFTPV
jgi:hypothetical protein